MIVALIALFVALGGTAAMAKILITSSGQLKDGVVHRADLAANAVDTAKVRNGTLRVDDFSAQAKGAIQAAGTQALEAFRSKGPDNQGDGAKAVVATLDNIPPGAYAIFAKTVLTALDETGGFVLVDVGNSGGGHCELDVGGDADSSFAFLRAPGATSPGTVSTQITHTYSNTGKAKLTCDVVGSTWRASNTSIIALRVGASPRQVVSGRR
jgi:hypothetical protein